MQETPLSLDATAFTAVLAAALTEDIGPGDATCDAMLDGAEIGTAEATAKTDLVVAGMEIFRETFLQVDPTLRVDIRVADGQRVPAGTVLARIEGPLKPLLMAERVALNFLQRLCGIATLTRRFVDAVAGTKAVILDTRKTVPGLRALDKYAVRAGGGRNHRFALYDAILIKDNHIAAAGGVKTAIARARTKAPAGMTVEVEVRSFAELDDALAATPDIIMLDNMTPADMAEAVQRVAGRIPLEASGNVSLETVRAIAKTGVDFISVGALTHSVAAADISLTIAGYRP